jgi:hypothetical protein
MDYPPLIAARLPCERPFIRREVLLPSSKRAYGTCTTRKTERNRRCPEIAWAGTALSPYRPPEAVNNVQVPIEAGKAGGK